MPVISEDPATTAEPTMRKGRHTLYGVRPEQIAAMTDMYPGDLTWRRTFPGAPEQVREARRFVAFLLADAACREDAELIVSELATNAVAHTSSGHPHGTFVVEVVRAATRVRIAVYDCGWGGTPPIPTPRPPHPNAPNGRGLAIVAALATEVGFEAATTSATWSGPTSPPNQRAPILIEKPEPEHSGRRCHKIEPAQECLPKPV